MPETIETILSVLSQAEADQEHATEIMYSAGLQLAFGREHNKNDYSCCQIDAKQFAGHWSELEYYLNKRVVLEAALARARDLAQKEKWLEAMEKKVHQIFLGLDAKTRTLLDVYMTLRLLDSVTEHTDYSGLLDDLGPVCLDALETDPKLRLLVEVYHAADELLDIQ
jgi:hypothetical protein